MIYISLPEPNAERHLSFYLAMEEYVARHLQVRECFFQWQVAPSVIFGRNQMMEQEVCLDYCQRHGIRVYRRKSGGGCVYADRDNLMLSYVSDTDQVGLAFNSFVNMLLLVLRKMGVEAVGTTHNDIMIGQRKVSGTACYHVAGHSIVHGTLLYDTNMAHMLGTLTPGSEKLEAKGISSVRQRITLLKDHTTLTLDEVKGLIRKTLCDGERVLTASEVADIELLEQAYLKEEFIHLL